MGEVLIKRSAIERLQTRFTAQTSSDAELERIVSGPDSKQMLREFAFEELSKAPGRALYPSTKRPACEKDGAE
jgi:hypothetical protein